LIDERTGRAKLIRRFNNVGRLRADLKTARKYLYALYARAGIDLRTTRRLLSAAMAFSSNFVRPVGSFLERDRHEFEQEEESEELEDISETAPFKTLIEDMRPLYKGSKRKVPKPAKTELYKGFRKTEPKLFNPALRLLRNSRGPYFFNQWAAKKMADLAFLSFVYFSHRFLVRLKKKTSLFKSRRGGMPIVTSAVIPAVTSILATAIAGREDSPFVSALHMF